MSAFSTTSSVSATDPAFDLAPKAPLELWGGVECSCVRIGNRVEDQQARSGHDRRIEDLDRFASLGIVALRQPVLWEHHACHPVDWRRTDERLARLRGLGLRPIVGFLHHGAGPLPGGLLDPGFVAGLAAFAGEFARRYPWVEDYTPINEPLTTARFGGLYGVWHPHAQNLEVFVRALLNQCAAIRAAMRAIRAVVPHARLIQTEDVGKTHGTARLAYQIALENERRWLSFDLLCGLLGPGSPMWAYLRAGGASVEELREWQSEPCPPDVLGMNHYVTSERFLDERLERYPPPTHGGNGRDRYADVPAVRAHPEELAGWGGLIREMDARYHRPLALTEVQLACTREEQVRWFLEAWRAAESARDAGLDVRAVTAWALLGAYDWDSLLLQARGSYENGAFDVRGPAPRPTALAAALRALAAGRGYANPAVDASPGWWRRPVRLEFFPVGAAGDRRAEGSVVANVATAANVSTALETRPLLILGAGGALGRAFVRLCALRGLPVLAWGRAKLDLARLDGLELEALLARHRPWAVVNAAGFSQVDEAERDAERCFRVNADGPAMLAAACATRSIPLVVFSSSLVCDGRSSRPCLESDLPAPRNVYGRSKAEMERRVAVVHPGALIVRTSAFFSPWDTTNFASATLRRLQAGETVVAADDTWVSPTYVPDLVNATLDMLVDGETGLWHVANAGATSWADWTRALATLAGIPVERIAGVPFCELGRVAVRPRWSVLGSERGQRLPCWRAALHRWLASPWQDETSPAFRPLSGGARA